MKVPLLSFTLFFGMLTLFYLYPNHELYYFNAEKIIQGEYWRLVSAHFIHADARHLTWNAVVLLILASVVEQYSRTILWGSIISGMVVIDLCLISPLSRLEWYCGFSGVLNSLLVIALWLEWRKNYNVLFICIGLLALAKIIGEIVMQQSYFTQMSWHPYPMAHLWGFFAGIGVLLYTWRRKFSLVK